MTNLTKIPPPFLVSVISDSDPACIDAEITQSNKDGAEAIELNLAQIAERDLPRLKALVVQSTVPVYTTCRRREFMGVYGYDISQIERLDDEQRLERQMGLLKVGAAIDFELDTFAESGARTLPYLPRAAQECTYSDRSVRRQKDIIEAVHALGREVIISCHTGMALSTSETVLLAQVMQERGADVVKIIHKHTDANYCAELWKSILALRSCLRCPFVLSTTGPGSAIMRRIGSHLGCSYTFVRPETARYFYSGHPKLSEMQQLYSLFPPEIGSPRD